MYLPFSLPSLKTLSICVLFSACLLAQASAMTLREFRALEKSDRQGPNYASYYLVGSVEGILEAHLHDLRNGAKAVICLNGRRLEPHMVRGLFDAELRRNEGVYEADMPVQLVLRNALEGSYGC